MTVVIGNILAFAATLMGIGQATKTSNAIANLIPRELAIE